MKNLLTSWMQGAFGATSRKRVSREIQSAQMASHYEALEERVVMDVTLPALTNANFIGGQDLYVALPGTDSNNNPITYTASSSSASVNASILTGGRSIKMTVSGTDANGQAFTGQLTFRLFESSAPNTTAQIINYTQQGKYNGLTFHRILDNFVIQGGDPNGDGSGGFGNKLSDEFSKNLTFTSQGLLAMANSGDDTSDSQFFVTDTDLPLSQMPQSLNLNYTIFGVLTSGFDTYQKIIKTPVTSNGSGENSKPVNPVTMSNVQVFDDTTNGVLKVTAVNGFSGSSTVTVTATGSGTPATRSMVVTGVPSTQNNPPFLGSVTNQSTAINTPITFTVQGLDIENDILTFLVKDPTSANSNSNALSNAANPLHGTVSINAIQANGTTPASAQITFTPETGFTGSIDMLLAVRDNTTHSGSTAQDAKSNYDTQKITLNVTSTAANNPPVADAGGPYTGKEGDGVTLDASKSTDPDNDTLTFSWDVNGDGTFGDATGKNPTLTKAQLDGLGINNGTATFNVKVQVDDGHGHVVTSPATTFTFNNAPPTATITGPESGKKGDVLTFTLGATDPSSVDQNAGFSWKIDWDGDGTFDQTVTGKSTQTVTHTFTKAGPFTVKVKAVDQDGGESPVVTKRVNIQGVDLVNGNLNIVGSDKDDLIKINTDSNGKLHLYMNHVDMGQFDVTGKINIEGGDGDDRIFLWPDVKNDAVINGGDGDDKIKGGKGNDVIHGDAGNDTLVGRRGRDSLFGDAGINTYRGGGGSDIIVGGSSIDEIRGNTGRDILIGGDGADFISGGSKGDLMIGSTTDFDDDLDSLNIIRDAWNQKMKIRDRITLLQSVGVGPNKDIKLDVNGDFPTVQDDNEKDKMMSIFGKNWSLGFSDDRIVDPDHKGIKTIPTEEETA